MLWSKSATEKNRAVINSLNDFLSSVNSGSGIFNQEHMIIIMIVYIISLLIIILLGKVPRSLRYTVQTGPKGVWLKPVDHLSLNKFLLNRG